MAPKIPEDLSDSSDSDGESVPSSPIITSNLNSNSNNLITNNTNANILLNSNISTNNEINSIQLPQITNISLSQLMSQTFMTNAYLYTPTTGFLVHPFSNGFSQNFAQRYSAPKIPTSMEKLAKRFEEEFEDRFDWKFGFVTEKAKFALSLSAFFLFLYYFSWLIPESIMSFFIDDKRKIGAVCTMLAIACFKLDTKSTKSNETNSRNTETNTNNSVTTGSGCFLNETEKENETENENENENENEDENEIENENEDENEDEDEIEILHSNVASPSNDYLPLSLSSNTSNFTNHTSNSSSLILENSELHKDLNKDQQPLILSR